MKIREHRMFLLFWPAFAFALTGHTATPDSSASQSQDWELIRTVSNPYGGTENLVLIPEARKQNPDYYKTIGLKLCGERGPCMAKFWTNKEHIPASARIPVKNLWEMTATFEVHPTYKGPEVHLACWLYKDRESGEAAKCFYMPGKKYWQQTQQ